MRLAAVLAITAAAYFVFELNRSFWDVGALVLFGLLGVACKILGWNRLVLILAFIYGRLLEEKLLQALVISKGDLAGIMERPITVTLLALAAAVFALVAAVSVRRALMRKQLQGDQP
jgi:TctA family transporter